MLATQEAKSGDLAAARWLQSQDAELFLDAFSIHPDSVRRWQTQIKVIEPV
jgi:hypothetical protein